MSFPCLSLQSFLGFGALRFLTVLNGISANSFARGRQHLLFCFVAIQLWVMELHVLSLLCLHALRLRVRALCIVMCL